MNVSLTRELEDFIHTKVAGGGYRSASEVVREALRLLQGEDALRSAQIEELRRQIQLGVDQLAAEQPPALSEQDLADLFEDIKANGRKRLAQRSEGS